MSPTPTPTPTPIQIDERRELRTALWLTFAVLVLLTGVKPLGGIPYVGAVAFTIAAIVQLYLPLWRVDKLGVDHDFIGLHFGAWRKDLEIVLVLIAVTFPPYLVAHYLFMTSFHDWALALGLDELARFLPRLRFTPTFPTDAGALLAGTGWFLELVATHALGVALPEETFYRGYLQPRLEKLWPPERALFGVKIGRAAVVASALFALGHFLGEWNPMRFGPFLPGLVFAWQRNASGSVIGAITYHAACNLFGEILSTQYSPG